MEANKKLFGGAAAYIMGMKPLVEVKGTKEQVGSFREVLIASKRLYESLQSEDLELVKIRIEEKKQAARRFESVMGIRWPL